MHKIGIIGFGKMGKIRAATVEECGGEVVIVNDVSKNTDKYKFTNSVDEVINHPLINSIFICTPNSFNKEYTIRSLLSGKNVFCEKPPALNAVEVKEVMDVEQKTKKHLMYGFNHRHHDSVKKIKEFITDKTFGNIVWMRGRYGKNIESDYFKGWRANPELSGGGILIDQGIHMVDLFLHLADNFDKINSFSSHKYWKCEGIEDNVFAILKNTKTEVTAELHSTMANWRHLFSLEIFLTDGYITLNGLRTSSGAYGDEILTLSKKNKINETLNEFVTTYKLDKSWNSEIDYFFNQIETNKPIIMGNSKDALKLMKIIDTIYSQKEL